MKLKDLCKYYISCIALENNITLRASMKDEQSFINMPWLNKGALKMSVIEAFLRGNHDKEKELLIGYPVLKSKHFLSPLFIIHISYNDGESVKPKGFSIDDDIILNKDIIDLNSATL
ncbi:MAG: hypothetical protein UHT92_07075 [Prevotella sp.]|nr:hypothetical protein [Prevotella sp.]